MNQHLECQNCGAKATRVFKTHAPFSEKDKTYAHACNIFLCENCSFKPKGKAKQYERYAPIRTNYRPAGMETLPNDWEKEWRVLYYINNLWVYVHPKATLYLVVTPN